MSKARDLADFVAAGNQLADGVINVAEIGDLTATAAELNTLDGITATVTELNKLDGVTSTTNELNILNGVTSTTNELNILDGVTATTAELNHVDGVTSNVQTQIDTKDAITQTVTVITADTTAVAGQHYYINGSAITLTLPASPSTGDYVVISDVSGNTDNIVARNSSNIMSLAEDLNLDQTYFNEKMVYTGATVGWAFA